MEINRANNTELQGLTESLFANKSNSRPLSGRLQADASLQTRYASLIDQALQPDNTDGQKISEARQLLASGRLDDPENARKAAENILKLGI